MSSTANSSLFIPTKIKVGFQSRTDTYTNQLAYIIYFDHKGTLRKERSWQAWRDAKINPQEFDNKPTEGFVLNKDVGGYKTSWNFRKAHIRVYDPRGFEFEIDLPNLLFILSRCNCSRGKGLEGKFVYAWDGTELVLLPADSEDYKQSETYTSLQSQSISRTDLSPGSNYLTKEGKTLSYLGFLPYYYLGKGYRDDRKVIPQEFKKRHVFWSNEVRPYSKVDLVGLVYLDGLKKIACLAPGGEKAFYDSLAEKLDLFYKSSHGSPIKKFSLDKACPHPPGNHTFFYEDNGYFYQCRQEYWGNNYSMNRKFHIDVEGQASIIQINETVDTTDSVYPRGYYGSYEPASIVMRMPSSSFYSTLVAHLESGSKINAEYNSFPW